MRQCLVAFLTCDTAAICVATGKRIRHARGLPGMEHCVILSAIRDFLPMLDKQCKLSLKLFKFDRLANVIWFTGKSFFFVSRQNELTFGSNFIFHFNNTVCLRYSRVITGKYLYKVCAYIYDSLVSEELRLTQLGSIRNEF